VRNTSFRARELVFESRNGMGKRGGRRGRGGFNQQVAGGDL
jgi:hypothetical protein